MSQASVWTTFLKHCGRGEGRGNTTCPKSVSRLRFLNIAVEVKAVGTPRVPSQCLDYVS